MADQSESTQFGMLTLRSCFSAAMACRLCQFGQGVGPSCHSEVTTYFDVKYIIADQMPFLPFRPPQQQAFHVCQSRGLCPEAAGDRKLDLTKQMPLMSAHLSEDRKVCPDRLKLCLSRFQQVKKGVGHADWMALAVEDVAVHR